MTQTLLRPNAFDAAASRRRCAAFRKRILDISQTISALHIAPAFSCQEILDAVYFGLMRRDAAGQSPDTFILSKGHGCMAQYAILEHLGVISKEEMDTVCKDSSRYGAHPDYGLPGIEASTGSLGHGLALGLGMAYADRVTGADRYVYVCLSDGEMQEGSVWEAMMMAPNLGADRLIAFIDNNDFQSLGRTSETHPSFYPMLDKVRAFGWECAEVDGHDAAAIAEAVLGRAGGKPFLALCRTTKGKGVSYMENVPIWHYRSPNPAEYQQALAEIDAALAEAEQ